MTPDDDRKAAFYGKKTAIYGKKAVFYGNSVVDMSEAAGGRQQQQ